MRSPAACSAGTAPVASIWFALVADMGDLSYSQAQLLRQHAAFFRHIESARMERSYKMLVLLAMFEEHALPGSLPLTRLAQRFEQITHRTTALQAELAETMRPDGPYPDLLSMLRSNPLRAWAETKRGGRSDYFTLDKDAFTSPTHFTWQSQNQTKKIGKHGTLIQNHKALGKEIHLFVRNRSKLPNQTAAPFYYCGQLDFQSWEGEKPITVEWELKTRLPETLGALFL